MDYGRAVYLPPAALAEHIIATDVRCRFPGCGMPAARCDLDHRIPFNADPGDPDPGDPDFDDPGGGPPCPCNLQALCRTHHRNKTFTGWSITPHPGGAITWTSNLGPTATDHPEHPPHDPTQCDNPNPAGDLVESEHTAEPAPGPDDPPPF